MKWTISQGTQLFVQQLLQGNNKEESSELQTFGEGNPPNPNLSILLHFIPEQLVLQYPSGIVAWITQFKEEQYQYILVVIS